MPLHDKTLKTTPRNKYSYLVPTILLILLLQVAYSATNSTIQPAQYNNPYDPAREKYRPVIGGIQIEIKTGLLTTTICTSSFAATFLATEGIVSAGHCSNFEILNSVRQPRWLWNEIGIVYMTDKPSDSLFVDLNDETTSSPQVLHIVKSGDKYYGIKLTVIDYYEYSDFCRDSEKYRDETIFYKTGRTTGTTSGRILLCRLELDTRYAGTLRKVFLMDIYVESGDSGAPVYLKYQRLERAKLLGIVSGAIYSNNQFQYSIVVSITSIKENLGVKPIIGG